jgi:hypothetical protein
MIWCQFHWVGFEIGLLWFGEEWIEILDGMFWFGLTLKIHGFELKAQAQIVV